jgi:hypothetical protein
MNLTEEEHEVVRKASEYESLKNQPGYRNLINCLADHCTRMLGELEMSEDLDPVHTARIVDRWKASERLFQSIQVEIQSSIDNANNIIARYGKGEPDGR